MKIIKEISKLNKNKQHIHTCIDDVKKYNIEVINNTTSNAKVTIGIVIVAYDIIAALDDHKNVIIEPGYSKIFAGIVCVNKEKIFIESTIKDISIIISEV